MEINTIINGDCLEVLKEFPDDCIDSVITSPPYYQLRDYGFDGQWGLEKTYQEYLDKMISLMAELKRVLKPTGTMWINLGDTYSTQSGANTEMLRTGIDKQYDSTYLTNRGRSPLLIKQTDYPNKSLMLIPHRFAIRCIDELGLILRNDITWAKRNGMPESVTDRFSKKHEYMFFFVKSQKYYFDLDAVREKQKAESITRDKYGYNGSQMKGRYQIKNEKREGSTETNGFLNPNGKNPGDVSDFWDIPTKPSSKEHYATFNTDLISRPIIAGSPESVCKKCGKPREKIYGDKEIIKTKPTERILKTQTGGKETTFNGGNNREIIGLTDCGCEVGFEGGLILDPFAGTGTTLIRAYLLGRRVVGIEGKEEYCEVANKDLDIVKQQLMMF